MIAVGTNLFWAMNKAVKQRVLNHPWQLFVTRPATLLERALRCQGYHLAGLNHIVSTSQNGLCRIYVDADEWKKLERQTVRSLEHKGSWRLVEFKKRLKTGKQFLNQIKRIDVLPLAMVKTLFQLYGQITEAIIYTHLLEKQVDEKQKLHRYSNVVGHLHEYARRRIDELYEALVTKTKKSELHWYFPSEILEGRRVKKKVVQSRKKLYFLFSQKGRTQIWTGNAGRKLIFDLAKSQKIRIPAPQVSRILGTTAYPGIMRGKATVISDFRKLSMRNKIQIIITPMTEPRMIPYLRKVKGIVTDEGGLTSHAAILAREMKIPCLVGTKIATKVFKDGDVVEVNAEKGIVSKIK